MDAFGYVIKGNSKTASPDYIPSLIGIDLKAPGRGDPYFERIDIEDRTVQALTVSRFVTFDGQEPILAVRSPSGSYYIPIEELYEIAAFHHDDDTIDMIEMLGIRKAA